MRFGVDAFADVAYGIGQAGTDPLPTTLLGPVTIFHANDAVPVFEVDDATAVFEVYDPLQIFEAIRWK